MKRSLNRPKGIVYAMHMRYWCQREMMPSTMLRGENFWLRMQVAVAAFLTKLYILLLTIYHSTSNFYLLRHFLFLFHIFSLSPSNSFFYKETQCTTVDGVHPTDLGMNRMSAFWAQYFADYVLSVERLER